MKILFEATPYPDGEPRWKPNTDVVVSVTGEMVLTLELAGLTREDLEIAIDGSRLRIGGHRRHEERAEARRYLVMEIANGPFEIVFDVPPEYDLCQAKAVYEVGFLRIHVPSKR